MNAPALPRQFSAISENTVPPASPENLARLRESIPHIPDIHAFGQAVSEHGTKQVVMEGGMSDFDTVWQFGRLLHNTDRPEDAISYFQLALELAPDNRQALGRLAEVALELHEQLPGRHYDVLARDVASKLITLEDSDYARDLHALSVAHVGFPEMCDGVVYSQNKI